MNLNLKYLKLLVKRIFCSRGCLLMLLTSFEILESLYSDLNDFNIEVKNIQEENEYSFENKYDKNCKIYIEIVYAYSNHLLIKDFFIKDKNGNFCNYKNLPAILKFKFFSNEFEEFRANKNGTFKRKTRCR